MAYIGQIASGTVDYLLTFAHGAYDLAVGYLDELHDYVVGSIDTTPPTISVDIPTSITIDPSLSAEIPEAPPDSAYPTLPADVTMNAYDFPTRPTYTMPTAPTLSDIAIPEFIEGTIREITADLPAVDFTAPGVPTISTFDVPLSDLINVMRQKLTDNIENGGTMLNPDVEADIWNRDRERRDQLLQDTIDKAVAQWAKLGFELPDGLLAGQLLAINNEYMNKDIDVSRDIAIKQAELEQQGMFKSIELGSALEHFILQSGNEYANRALQAMKSTADVTIEIYKQRVTQYNAMLEQFKADVEAFKASIQAEISRAEAYKAHIQGLQAVVQIDESKVKLYTSHIAAITSMVELYNTEVKAVATQYEAERSKIEAYKSNVQAYIAKVEGVTKKYLAEMEGFKSYVTAWSASAESQTKLTDLRVRGEIAELEATMKAWEVQEKILTQNVSLKLEALKTLAQTASTLAAGSLSAVHASLSDTSSMGVMTSTSHNYSY